MKKILFFLFLHLSYLSFSQIGISTTTPRGILDLNITTTNTFGLVLPTNESTTNMLNPQGGDIALGTLMYDSTDDCLKYYYQNTVNDSITKWSPCILQVTDENVIKLDYRVIGRSFTGNYKEDTPMVAANTFKIAVTNEAYGTANITFLTSDLVLSGVEGITVTSVSPTTSTLTAGGTVEVTYTLSGTPADCGTLTGTWTKADLEYTRSISIVPNLIYNCAEGSWNDSVSPENRITGLVNGQSYTGTYSVPYSGGSASSCDLPPETIVRDGLTLTFAGGPVSETGTIYYSLSGTYTGTTGAITFVTSTGCTIYLGPCNSCKEILDTFPGSPDGQYLVNLNKGLSDTADSRTLYCDMTTDGGGWALISVNGSSLPGGQTQKSTLTGVNDKGYLPRVVVVKIATIASQVQLRSGTSATSYANEVTSQSGGAAILALRNTATTIAGAGTWHVTGAINDFMANTTNPPLGSWVWTALAGCTPSSNGWPNMYHACGIGSNVHWLMGNPSTNRTSGGDPWASTWVR